MEGRNFEVSIISTSKTTKHLDGEYLEEWMNQNFQLFKYGDGVDEIFILFSVSETEADGSFRYHPEERFLELTVPLPEKELHNAEEKEALLVMASALLSTLQSIPRRAMETFDISTFRADFAEMVA